MRVILQKNIFSSLQKYWAYCIFTVDFNVCYSKEFRVSCCLRNNRLALLLNSSQKWQGKGCGSFRDGCLVPAAIFFWRLWPLFWHEIAFATVAGSGLIGPLKVSPLKMRHHQKDLSSTVLVPWFLSQGSWKRKHQKWIGLLLLIQLLHPVAWHWKISGKEGSWEKARYQLNYTCALLMSKHPLQEIVKAELAYVA